MIRNSKTTDVKYLGFLTAISRDGNFNGPVIVKNLKVNAALPAVLKKLGWTQKISKKRGMYKYIGPKPTEESIQLLRAGVKKYGEDSRKKTVLRKMQAAVVVETPPIKDMDKATILVDHDEQAALLAELAVKLGKKDILGFIRQGQKSF